MKVSKRLLFAVLLSAVVASMVVNVFLYLSWNLALRTLREEHTPKTYVFTWPPTSQNITSGTLYLNMSFDIIGDKMHIIARINDNDTGRGEWGGHDLAQIAFDENRDGRISGKDGAYYLPFYNITKRVSLWLHVPIFPWTPLIESYHHTCWFTEGVGSIFNITFTKQELNIHEEDTSMPVHFFYWDNNAHGCGVNSIYVQFMVPLGDEPLWTP